MKTPTTTKLLVATLNAALYAAAEKAGFAAILRHYQGEVWVSCHAGKTSAYFTFDAESVNADHECEIFEHDAARIAAEARAEKWLAAYCTAKFPYITTG